MIFVILMLRFFIKVDDVVDDGCWNIRDESDVVIFLIYDFYFF